MLKNTKNPVLYQYFIIFGGIQTKVFSQTDVRRQQRATAKNQQHLFPKKETYIFTEN